MTARLVALAGLLLTLALLPQAVFAAAPAQSSSADGNLGFLLAGTALAWAGFMAYAYYLGRRNRDMRREIEELRRILAEREPREPG